MGPREGESGVIFGLDHPARVIASQLGDGDQEDKAVFVAATQSLKSMNQVYVLEYEEECNRLTRRSYQHQAGEVWHLACCPTDKHLLATCYSGVCGDKVKPGCSLWSLPSQEGADLTHLSTIDYQPVQAVSSFQWQPLNGARAVVSADDHLLLVDVQVSGAALKITDKIDCETKGQHKVGVSKWNPHHNCNSIGVLCDGAVKVFDVRSRKVQFGCDQAHSPTARDLDFNPNRQYYLATGGDDCALKIWDCRAFKEPLAVWKHSHWVWCVRYNPVHDQLVLSSSSDERLVLHCFGSLSSELYDTEGGMMADGVVRAFDDHEESVYACDWSAGDPWVFGSLSYDGRVIINKVPRDVKHKILQL